MPHVFSGGRFAVVSLRAEVESARLGEKFGGFTGIRSVALILSCRTVSALTVCALAVRRLVVGLVAGAALGVESGLAAGFFAESGIGAAGAGLTESGAPA